MPKKLDQSKLQEGLGTRLVGRSIFFSKQVTSTNKWAKKLANQGAPEGTVAIAETQTQGRGRLDRKWISPAGGLWFSVILRPRQGLADAPKLTFVAGLAVAQTLNEQYGLRTETKWPNDVLVNGLKISGTLGEMSTGGEKAEAIVLGIGVNANFDARRVLPESLKSSATSVQTELNRRIQLETLFKRLLEKLEATYALYTKKGFTPILKQWKNRAGFLGQQVEVTDKKEKAIGLAYDVDQNGALILMLQNGTFKRVFAGDVYLCALGRHRNEADPEFGRRIGDVIPTL